MFFREKKNKKQKTKKKQWLFDNVKGVGERTENKRDAFGTKVFSEERNERSEWGNLFQELGEDHRVLF